MYSKIIKTKHFLHLFTQSNLTFYFVFSEHRMIMDPTKYTFEKQVTTIEDYLDKYLKKKPPDCVLYSEDNTEFKIHKELFGQTDFMREILSSAKERCCGILEVFCPCSKEELSLMVKFLHTGEICCETNFDALNIVENLNKIFGFTKNLVYLMINVKKEVKEETFEDFATRQQNGIDIIISEEFNRVLLKNQAIEIAPVTVTPLGNEQSESLNQAQELDTSDKSAQNETMENLSEKIPGDVETIAITEKNIANIPLSMIKI